MNMRLSRLSETLIGSEIINLAGEIREKMRQGKKIYNFTIGDFDPALFPIPPEFEEEIVRSYREKNTHYPPAEGQAELRESVSRFIRNGEGLDYDPRDEILISCGGRPLIYAIYRTIVDPGEKVIYTVPSWNNNHYTHFVGGVHTALETSPEHNFMPEAGELEPHLKGASLLALCSPLNPTGTAFSKTQLDQICELVIRENRSRGSQEKKLFVLYDQIYWTLTYGDTRHYDPVSLRPELRDYTIYVDGMSKAFASTGVRLGWAMGPRQLINRMKAILSHIGAWSPMAEQVAAARYLRQDKAIGDFQTGFRAALHLRLEAIYAGFLRLKQSGYPVDAIAPQAAIYLTVKLDLAGRLPNSGPRLDTQAEVTSFLLEDAGLALVPFHAFGAPAQNPWYRLSVGTCRMEEIPEMFTRLEASLKNWKSVPVFGTH